MPRYSIQNLLQVDRPWSCGHYFRAHRGRFRRWFMGIFFTFLCLVIGGYTYLTDSDRVRLMAQAYLSKLVGGRVEIGRASLSIFQGLRVDDVKLSVDGDGSEPDSLLFSAQSLLVSYNPQKLIAGQLDATEIVTQKPRVYLTFTQNATGDHWNFERLKASPSTTKPDEPMGRLLIPTLLLRNAVCEIGQLRSGQRRRVGSMAIDGQLTPAGDGAHYAFSLQSRGLTLGPSAHGTIDAVGGRVLASLNHVEFGDDLRSMLPVDVRSWWERHELSGRIESVDLTYDPARNRQPPKFSIAAHVQGITLAVRREEWSGREDIDRLEHTENAIGLLRAPFELAGYRPTRADSTARSTRVEGNASSTAIGTSPIANLLSMIDASPVVLREVTGVFVFNPTGIDVNNLLVRVGTGDARNPQGTNAFRIEGRIDGYRPDAPLKLSIDSAEPGGLYFPSHPTFLASVPRDVRDFYEQLQPEGTCRVHADVNRNSPGAKPQVGAVLDVLDAKFLLKKFAYPFRNAAGKIAFGRDPFSGKDFISILDLHAYGMPGGPNAAARVTLSGRIGPLSADQPDPAFELRASGAGINSEPALRAVMPWDVAHALNIFDAPGKGEFPIFKGNFVATVLHAAGGGKHIELTADLDLQHAEGRIVDFPYPCKHAEGKIRVHNDHVEILDVMIATGNARAQVTGDVRWASGGRLQPVDLNVNLRAQDVPLDEDLITSIPGNEREWLHKLGISGTVNAEGKIYTVVPENWRDLYPWGSNPPNPKPIIDLSIGVRDGTVWPADGLFSVSQVAGLLHLHKDGIDILALHGNRDKGNITASGRIEFGQTPALSLRFDAREMTADRALYAMLPPDGRRAWDEVRPSGIFDAQITYDAHLGALPNGPLASTASTANLPPERDSFTAVLHPRAVKTEIRTVPYPITFNQGTITITPGHAVLKDLAGVNKDAAIHVSGEGTLSASPDWQLALHADRLPIDAELRHAVPPMLITVLDSLKLQGGLTLDLPTVSYRNPQGSTDPDVDIKGTVALADGSIDAGVPLTGIRGSLRFATSTRSGKVDRFEGAIDAATLSMGNRQLTDLHMNLLQTPGSVDLHIDKVQARVAQGEIAGGATLTIPDKGSSKYKMNLIVRNADVRDLTGETDPNIKGDLTASLALEGTWGAIAARRGRGDVVVVGKQLYHIPLVLGMLQVTNLSLPLSGPFTRGTARYNVEGNRVNFEQMALRSDTMSVNGSGWLDFGSRQVNMTLTTDSAAGLKVPFISDIIRGAGEQLLRINVRGTVQQPKVEPTSLGIFSTSIDQVFRGDAPAK